jgi:hypothetical protein
MRNFHFLVIDFHFLVVDFHFLASGFHFVAPSFRFLAPDLQIVAPRPLAAASPPEISVVSQFEKVIGVAGVDNGSRLADYRRLRHISQCNIIVPPSEFL